MVFGLCCNLSGPFSIVQDSYYLVCELRLFPVHLVLQSTHCLDLLTRLNVLVAKYKRINEYQINFTGLIFLQLIMVNKKQAKLKNVDQVCYFGRPKLTIQIVHYTRTARHLGSLCFRFYHFRRHYVEKQIH